MEIGYFKGDICNRNGCQGTMQRADGVCRCHLNPPCSYCENNEIICDECGEVFATGDKENWQNEINLKGNKMLKIINIDIKPTYEVDNYGVMTTKLVGESFEIKILFDKDGVPTYRFHTSMRIEGNTIYFSSLDEAKAYIERLMMGLTLDHIKRVAEIVE